MDHKLPVLVVSLHLSRGIYNAVHPFRGFYSSPHRAASGFMVEMTLTFNNIETSEQMQLS